MRGEEDRCPPSSVDPTAHHPGRGPGGGPAARYEQLRHAAMHARAEAFGLGLAVLTGNGLIAWTRVCAEPIPTPSIPPCAPDPELPAARAPSRELVNALAALALAPTRRLHPTREKGSPRPCPQTRCPK